MSTAAAVGDNKPLAVPAPALTVVPLPAAAAAWPDTVVAAAAVGAAADEEDVVGPNRPCAGGHLTVRMSTTSAVMLSTLPRLRASATKKLAAACASVCNARCAATSAFDMTSHKPSVASTSHRSRAGSTLH